MPTTTIAAAPSRRASSAIPATTSASARSHRGRSRRGPRAPPPTGDLSPVDDRGPYAVRCALAHVELDAVCADVDHREPLGLAVAYPFEVFPIACVRPTGQADLAYRCDHRGGVLGFDRDRPVVDPSADRSESSAAQPPTVYRLAFADPHRAARPGSDQPARGTVERQASAATPVPAAERVEHPAASSAEGEAAFITGSTVRAHRRSPRGGP